jgi:hypothetical protein
MFSSLVFLRLLRYILALTGTAGTAFAVVTTIGPATPTPVTTPAPGVHASAPGAGQAGDAGAPVATDPGTTSATSTGSGATSASGTQSGTASSGGTHAGTASTGGATAGVPGGGTAGHAGGPIYIGSVAGGYQQALAGTGVPLADHTYSFFSGGVPQAAMLTVSAGGTPWREVAAAAPGSTLYAQIVTWAQTIKARGGSVMVAYNHEPEGHDRLQLGTSADFIAAYRHVETIFNQQGASNVVWTWQMTAYSFATGASSPQNAAVWYPGDEWIDNVGADAYNWFTCGQGNGTYRELKAIGDPVLAFARAHHKAASFPEFASDANGNRTQWLANAQQYFIQNRDVVTAAFYFNRPPTVAANADCKWGLTSSAEYAALRSMAQNSAYFRV